MRKSKWESVDALDLLGCYSTVCDGCRRNLDPHDDREHCFACRADLCTDCSRCCEIPERVTYPGLRQDENLVAVLDRARAHMKNSCGDLFPGRDNIYFAVFNDIIDLVREQHRGSASSSRDPRFAPEWLESRAKAAVRQWVSLKEMGRFVEYFARRAIAGQLPDFVTERCSQGMNGAIPWKGRPTMRTAWDLALSIVMMEEQRPKTIIELGTGSGGSAMWYADLQRANGLEANVLSVDIDPPDVNRDGISFLKGNLFQVEDVLPAAVLRGLPHPWLVVEDAHVNTTGILEYFDRWLEPDDYLVIEDIDAEQELGPFLVTRPGQYSVDSRYTDYFGHNATCAKDQILRRMM